MVSVLSISVGGMPRNRQYFGTLLSGVDHLPHTFDHERNAFSRGSLSLEKSSDELEDIIALHDASTIALS